MQVGNRARYQLIAKVTDPDGVHGMRKTGHLVCAEPLRSKEQEYAPVTAVLVHQTIRCRCNGRCS